MAEVQVCADRIKQASQSGLDEQQIKSIRTKQRRELNEWDKVNVINALDTLMQEQQLQLAQHLSKALFPSTRDQLALKLQRRIIDLLTQMTEELY